MKTYCPVLEYYGFKFSISTTKDEFYYVCLTCPYDGCVQDSKRSEVIHYDKTHYVTVQCHVCHSIETLEFRGDVLEGHKSKGIISSGRWEQAGNKIYHKPCKEVV